MKKKILSFILSSVIGIGACIGFTGCGGGTKTNIGVCLTNTSTTLNASISDAIIKVFPDKVVSVQSADNSVTTQINQINTFITMGVDMIVVTPN